jgi:hypothetical protein
MASAGTEMAGIPGDSDPAQATLRVENLSVRYATGDGDIVALSHIDLAMGAGDSSLPSAPPDAARRLCSR